MQNLLAFFERPNIQLPRSAMRQLVDFVWIFILVELAISAF